MKVRTVVETALWIILGGLLAAGAVRFALGAAMALQTSAVLDYGEGPLLNQARMVLEGKDLYRADLSDYPYTVTNYPPLYPLAVALVGRFLGISYATGRIVSVPATIWSGLMLALIVLRLTGDRIAAVVAGGLFLSFPYVVRWGLLGRVDMLALAFSLSGIFAAVRWPDSGKGLTLSLLLITAAIYTRQSYLLAAPLAVTVWLVTRNRRTALVWAVTLGLLVIAIFIFLNRITAGGFFLHAVTANANALSVRHGERMWGHFLLLGIPWIGILLGELLSFFRERPRSFWLPISYLIGGFLSALTVAKVGSNVNYFLEGVAAISMVAGMGVARWRRDTAGTVRLIPLLLLVFQIPWAWHWLNPVAFMEAPRAWEPEVRQLEHMVAAAPGPVLADEWMSTLVVSGRELLLQPYEYTRLAMEGKWDQSRLVADIRAGKFALILIADHPPFSLEAARDQWTPEMWAAIQEQYEPVAVLAGTTVYRPRNQINEGDP